MRNWDPEEEGAAPVVYPYYVESESLRDLAQSLKLELPTGKQVTKSRRLSFIFKGAGGESGKSETQEFGGQIPLLELAKKAEATWEYEATGPALRVADAALVSDESILSAAIDQIQGDFEATSQTADLLSRVKEAFGEERIQALGAKKREEFEAIAKENRMMVFKGQFAYKDNGREGCGPTLKLTHFNPSSGYISPRATGNQSELEADLIPIPEGVGIDIVLPDERALLPSGKERILRGDPFYAGVIAHSPSFSPEQGILTCSAWAVWGQETPNWSGLEMEHRFRGPGAQPGYGC